MFLCHFEVVYVTVYRVYYWSLPVTLRDYERCCDVFVTACFLDPVLDCVFLTI